MKLIHGDRSLLEALEADPALDVQDAEEFERRYDDLNERFHSHFSPASRADGRANAEFHKWRYCHMCRETLSGTVLDLGSDKPFLSFFLRKLNRRAIIHTVSFEIPQTPYDLYSVDIETDPLPFRSGSVDTVLFAEVLEHLWRDPAHALFEMNRVLRMNGELYLTTPNPCEIHAITCILWQANPNQRSQIFRNLESGHLHLWSSADLRRLLESSGFTVDLLTSYDAYRYTEHHEKVWEFVRSVSPHTELMGECLLARASKTEALAEPRYPREIFPDGEGVQFDGALRSFALHKLTSGKS
ncbi:methyltransferase domain-containing protein [Azospirillum sp. ST 5-10]|uniref:methyltransferase domain-containing protein n=1 Tax=unclassified Azospirillum TaxID=2630922 RepID=UPI003F49D062